jgi:4-amino-4-deoxy-L-arabinose transferase-like glycosyltransferase
VSGAVAGRERQIALGFVVIAFVLRLAWGISAGVTPGANGPDDAAWYHRTATLLANGRGYVSMFTGAPTAAWPPAYPVFLSVLYRLTGPTTTTAVVANAVFGALTCWLVWRFGVRLGTPRVGAVATALLAAFPGQIFFSALVLSETLFTCLACALWLVATALVDRRAPWRAWLPWGVALGAATLVRAEAIAFAVVPALVLALESIRDVRRAGKALAAVILGAAIALTPWTIRNALVFGAFVPTSTSFGRTFWIGHNPDANGGMTVEHHQTMQRRMIEAGLGPTDPARELAGNRLLLRDALAWAAAHPGREVGLVAARIYHLFRGDHVWQSWYGPGTPRPFPSAAARTWLGRLGDAYYLVVGLAAVAGWLRLRRGHSSGWRVLELSAFVWIGMYALIYGDPRFHHVLIPIACLLAASALVPAEREDAAAPAH